MKKFRKPIIFLILSIVLLSSLIPTRAVQADGNDPIALEVCVTWGKKDSVIAGIHFWIPDGQVETFGKTVQFSLSGQKNPNYVKFDDLVKVPGNQMFMIPEDFTSAWSKKAIELTDISQTLSFTIYDFDGANSVTLQYHIPTILEAQEGIKTGLYGPCLGDWYN